MKKLLLALVTAAAVLIAGTTPALATDNTQPGHWQYNLSGEGHDYNVGVCPPFEYSAWDLNQSSHLRVYGAMNEWNLGNGELRFYRTNVSCQGMADLHLPYVEVTWDIFATQTDFAFADVCYNSLLILCSLKESTPIVYRTIISLDYAKLNQWYWLGGIPDQNHWDVQSAVLHELGHSFPVGHATGNDNLVMAPVLPRGLNKRAVFSSGGYYHDQQNYTGKYGNTH